MNTRYDVALDGAPLSAIDESIIVTDIAYTAPVVTRQGASLAGRDGQIAMSRKTESVGVEITFEIHERNPARRMQIAQMVQNWATCGGWLTTTDRPEQRLLVECESPPIISSSMRWTQTLRIGFTAYALPYWQDAFPTTVTITGNGYADVFAPGSAAPCHVSGKVTNTGSDTITTADITCGDTAWHLRGLSLAEGQTLTFGHTDSDFVLYIVQNGASVLDKRTADSSDELRLTPGDMRRISITTNTGAHTAAFDIRGCYL